MYDIHLINMALAGIGVSAATALVIAAAVIAIAGIGRHKQALRHRRAGKPTNNTPGPVTRVPALR